MGRRHSCVSLTKYNKYSLSLFRNLRHLQVQQQPHFSGRPQQHPTQFQDRPGDLHPHGQCLFHGNPGGRTHPVRQRDIPLHQLGAGRGRGRSDSRDNAAEEAHTGERLTFIAKVHSHDNKIISRARSLYVYLCSCTSSGSAALTMTQKRNQRRLLLILPTTIQTFAAVISTATRMWQEYLAK